jgi:hypothetical protein
MAGDKARSNLGTYISRWSKVPGADIVSAGRGLWTVKGAEKPVEVPSFLASNGGSPVVDATGSGNDVAVTVPPFLAAPPASPAEPPQDSDDLEDTSEPLELPEGFPGRQALIDAGFDTQDKLAGKTHDQLRRIKGVGAETARNILAALEA